MEIVFDKLTINSVKDDKKLNKVSLKFSDKEITFCSGLSGKILKDLLYGKKQIISGNILGTVKLEKKDIGYAGNNPVKDFKTKSVIDEFEYYNKEYNLGYSDIKGRAVNALLMVGLDESYLDRNFTTLSLSQLKKIEFSIILFYNPKLLILDYFEKGLNYKDLDNIKKILKKLQQKFNKNIIIFSDDLDKYMDILDNFIIFNKGNIVVSGLRKDLYNEDIYKYIECPLIIKFVKKVKDNNVDLLNYFDIKELIKAIYRDVENK